MFGYGIIAGFILAIICFVGLYFLSFKFEKCSKEEYDLAYEVLRDAMQISNSNIQAWHGDHLLSEFTFGEE